MSVCESDKCADRKVCEELRGTYGNCVDYPFFMLGRCAAQTLDMSEDVSREGCGPVILFDEPTKEELRRAKIRRRKARERRDRRRAGCA